MSKSTLGLPLEYSTLHKFYDALCSGDTDSKNNLIETILKKHGVKTVLDLTCGTGSQVFWLAKRGYKVTGSDISPALLAQAREKAQQEKLDVTLLEGDMRTVKVGAFDAVITIFNAVGHLTKADFEKAMQNIHSNLNDGGLYVFDIFNLASMTDQVVDDLTMDAQKTINGIKIHHVQYSKIDRETGRLTSYDSFTLQERSGKPQVLTGEFTLQIYTAQELTEMLARSGFKVLEQCGLDGSTFSDQKTTNILTIAQKL
ncbi:class I SAM-dependent methyltransferase [Candidatus Babeliales bacterium]|nr:class I SAM-dependent methyltransferase [Candidatus Babeliales bacterium]